MINDVLYMSNRQPSAVNMIHCKRRKCSAGRTHSGQRLFRGNDDWHVSVQSIRCIVDVTEWPLQLTTDWPVQCWTPCVAVHGGCRASSINRAASPHHRRRCRCRRRRRRNWISLASDSELGLGQFLRSRRTRTTIIWMTPRRRRQPLEAHWWCACKTDRDAVGMSALPWV